jgi:hypothetical protein
MSKRFHAFAFGIGLAVIAWVGFGFIGSSWLALAMTAVIAAVYLFGAFELRQFRAATTALDAALRGLAEAPAALADWLERVPPALRSAVRLRVEGERVALPGPALTPYLVGLLVMLGMLGTFLGMVVTFKGAVFALEGSTDLDTIRAALAAPVKGLALSFGTSVAGVAASAMLGLMATICRRERLDVARRLDTQVATVLQGFSLTHQRQQTYRALQAQADVLPRVADQLQALMERIDERSGTLDRQLLERQAQFQRELVQAYGGLADRVGTSLQESVGASAKAAGEQVRPLVEGALAEVARQAQAMQEHVTQAAREQVAALSAQFEALAQGTTHALAQAAGEIAERTGAQAEATTRALAQSAAEIAERTGGQAEATSRALSQAAAEIAERTGAQAEATSRALAQSAADLAERTGAQAEATSRALSQAAAEVAERAGAQAQRTLEGIAQLVAQSEALVRERTEAEARFTAQHGARMDELAALWRSELAALREQEDRRGAAAVERLGDLQQAVGQHLATLGAALEAPITRLLQTASEVPQAAAGVIAQLREQMQGMGERDNLALAERNALLERFSALLGALQQASGEQRAAIDALLASASSVLHDAGAQFSAALQAQGAQAGDVAAQVTASAVELASVAEAFGASVQHFEAGNDKLTAALQAIEASLTRSTARSDEQLAYYVAQAREVIDLSIASQQGLVESLRELRAQPARTAVLADEVAE